MTLTKAIARLVVYAPHLIASKSRARARCVLATAIGCDVLREYDIEAEPLPCTMTVFNRRYARAIVAGASPTSAIASGGHVMITDVTRTDDPKAWGGHLVIHVPAAHCIIDLDLQQFRRPQHDVHMPAADTFDWAPYQTAGEYKVLGSTLRYERTSDERFKQGKDWADVQLRRPLVEAVSRAVRRG